MIQRIQSIFLLLASASGFGLLGLPIATTPEGIQNSALFSDGMYEAGDSSGLVALFALAGILALAGIFMFRNRQAQIKITWLAIVADVLGVVLAAILLWQDGQHFDFSAVDTSAGVYLPFSFLLFGILALRHIRKDEKIVRSMDRLR